MEGENESELKGLGLRGQPEVDGRLGVERVQRRMRPSETGLGFDPAHWSGCRGDGKCKECERKKKRRKQGRTSCETAKVRGRPDE